MNPTIRIIVGAEHAYACITGIDESGPYSLDVNLAAGKSPAASLAELAADMEADIIRRARRRLRVIAALQELTP